MYEQHLDIDLSPPPPLTISAAGPSSIMVDISGPPLAASGRMPEELAIDLYPTPPIIVTGGGVQFQVTPEVPVVQVNVDAPAVVVGVPGPTGAPGAAGTAAAYRGMYDWNTTPELDPPTGEISGYNIPAATLYGLLKINQIDANNLNCSFFSVAPGQHLIIRDQNFSGLHDLIITKRTLDSQGDCVYIEYWVKSTTGTPVQGWRVEAAVYAADPSGEPITGPPGPPGPEGPQGIPGTGSATKLRFNFATPAVTWTIDHNIGGEVEVNCYDFAGNEYDVEIDYPTDRQAIVRWYYPTAGIAEVIG